MILISYLGKYLYFHRIDNYYRYLVYISLDIIIIIIIIRFRYKYLGNCRSIAACRDNYPRIFKLPI